MNWEAIGAIGEILGAIAVVITVLYLARQTRASAKAVVSASRNASAIAISEIDREDAGNPELARVVHKSMQDPIAEYDEIEWLRFTTFARSLFGLYEEQYMQSLDGTTDASAGEVQVAAAIGFLELPAWEKYWDREGGEDTWFRRQFIDAVNLRLTSARIRGSVIAGRI
jgi:hypothetical protein